jgi:type VI secretion system secreted protein VgrG
LGLPVLPPAVNPPLNFDEQFRIFQDDGESVRAGARYKITSASGQVWKGVTDSQGFTQRVYTASPEPLSLSYDLEEEEEEEELEGITLRLGLFFDGTGNNLTNSAATAQCRRDDLSLFKPDELTSIIQLCNQYGFDGFDGSAFNSSPDNSYGNAPSNVAHLYDLYPDSTATPIPVNADIGYLKVYLEGIGTRSGGSDDVLVGQAFGAGKTGVVARVQQAPDLIKRQLDLFQQANPGTDIRRIEFDIFGFSRGAAAARHCVNELLKPRRGLFAELLHSGRFGLLKNFDPAVDVSLNLVGLFDTVAAVAAPGRADLNVADADNPGVNLYLPPGCARQVIQLQARDENRENFALNSVQAGHRQISLPGVHSDIGGGYLPRAHERLILTKPSIVEVATNRPVESSPEWHAALAQAEALRASGLAGDGSIEVKAWKVPPPSRGPAQMMYEKYLLALVLDRPVRGELALVSLRLMRELGVRHGVPFEAMETRPDLALPEELQSTAANIVEQALAGSNVSLDPEQEQLLVGRYIHQSSHWTPKGGLMINKPAPGKRRNVYTNTPQKAYPQ